MSDVIKMGTLGTVDVRLRIITNSSGSPYLTYQGAEVLAVDITTNGLQQLADRGLSEGDFPYEFVNGEEDAFEGLYPILIDVLARRPNSKARMAAKKS